jgi:hypothetical protein
MGQNVIFLPIIFFSPKIDFFRYFCLKLNNFSLIKNNLVEKFKTRWKYLRIIEKTSFIQIIMNNF